MIRPEGGRMDKVTCDGVGYRKRVQLKVLGLQELPLTWLVIVGVCEQLNNKVSKYYVTGSLVAPSLF